MKILSIFLLIILSVNSIALCQVTREKINASALEAYKKLTNQPDYTPPKSIETQIDEKYREITEQIAELTKTGSKQSIVDETITQAIKHEIPINWTDRKDNLIHVVAWCKAAADVRCASPLFLLSDHLNLCVQSPMRFYRPSIFKEKKVETLDDYPVMSLALKCGESSLPALEKIMRDPEVKTWNTVTAFVLYDKIDSEGARALYSLIADQFSVDQRNCIEQYLRNPAIEPWVAWNQCGGKRLQERLQQQLKSKSE